ncbi:hypothetical protein HY639_03160 [Candidatus Woesearchaeota archaeon]|nr:hypothetical protein [Candidatus Woesearchaeota archaeon]
MTSVFVFPTYKDACVALQPYIDKNEPIHDALVTEACETVENYCQKHYPTPPRKYSLEGIPIMSADAVIPQEEIEKLVADVGKGRELTSLTLLDVVEERGNRYHFSDGIVTYSAESVSMIATRGNGYPSISALIDAIQVRLHRLGNRYNGATIIPLFYTVQEEHRCTKEEYLSLADMFFEGLLQSAPINATQKEQAEGELQLLRQALRKETYDWCKRGLSQEERTKFEKIF